MVAGGTHVRLRNLPHDSQSFLFFLFTRSGSDNRIETELIPFQAFGLTEVSYHREHEMSRKSHIFVR
jgi:hypothetical protein